jgi:hypothetical protein
VAIGNEDIVSGFNVIAKIGDMIMAQTEFLSFSFDIKMNEAPKGELVVLDRNSIAITGNEVGNYITFEFNHVATDRTEKSSSMICIIDDIDQCTGLEEFVKNRFCINKIFQVINGTVYEKESVEEI